MCRQCNYTTWEINPRQTYVVGTKHQFPHRKASGVVLICKDKVLLVRSYERWGFPKGTLKHSEAPFTGACRELMEETGLELSLPEETFQRWCPTDYSTFFIKEIDNEIKPRLHKIPMDSSNNDSSGVGWFKISCVVDLVNSNTMPSNCFLKYFLDRLNRLHKHKKKRVPK